MLDACLPGILCINSSDLEHSAASTTATAAAMCCMLYAMLLMVPTTRVPATGVDGHALVHAIVLELLFLS